MIANGEAIDLYFKKLPIAFITNDQRREEGRGSHWLLFMLMFNNSTPVKSRTIYYFDSAGEKMEYYNLELPKFFRNYNHSELV